MALFALASALLIGGLGWIFAIGFGTAEARRAIWVSGWIAFAVQLVTFGVARLAAARNLIAAWGLGAALRLVTLAVYGLVIVGALALHPTAALVSLAAFFFITMLIEPLLLTL